MADDDLRQFSETFHADVASNAHAQDMLTEHAFVERIAETLIDYGELGSCEPCPYRAHGMKVDAYDFDDEYANLTLVISHWTNASDPRQGRVTNTEVERCLKWGRTFFMRALQNGLADKIELSNPAHDLARIIHECRDSLLSVKLVVVTDGIADQRPAAVEEHEGLELRSVVWDISRTHAFERTGEREQILIDFQKDYGGAIPCTVHASSDQYYETYLAFVPGSVLADLYACWKIRLLERNVRVFLSQRPKVNRGIRDTIQSEPGMFCAYNNGITVYAREVSLKRLDDGSVGIEKVTGFQIVNGGQTTASLYHTREKQKADLSGISVQMKLMVINDEMRTPELKPGQRLSDVLVPKIGRFSNTQNRVQMADLMANDPPHPELQAIAENTPAPDPTGGSLQTCWFYERSRGSYEEKRRLDARTPAQKKKFDQKFPRAQRFDKSKLGKAWNAYRKRPHQVCLGAMKNFARFNSWLQEQRDEDWQAFFRKTVALVLMWREAERLVRRQKFGGYTHAIVAYSLGWLHHLTDLKIDLDRIWSSQTVDESIMDALEVLSGIVNEHIRDTKLNVTEWTKKEECWKQLIGRKPPTLPDLSGTFFKKGSGKKYAMDSATETENISFCKEKGAEAWFALAKWLKERDFMGGKQRSQCFNMGRALSRKGKEPSAVLSAACRKIWENASTGYGWDHES